MSQQFTQFLGIRYLKPQKGQGFAFLIAIFSFLGMTLGVATLIVVMSVMNGFKDKLFSNILGINGHISVHLLDNQSDYLEAASAISKDSDVTFATPIINGQVLASSEYTSLGVLVRGIRKEDIIARPALRSAVDEDALKDFVGKDTVLIGHKLAASLGVHVGDEVRLISPKRSSTAFGMIPRNKTYTIIGLMNFGMDNYDKGFVYMPLEAAQLFFKMKDQVSEIEVVTTAAYDLEAVKSRINQILRDKEISPVMVRSWQEDYKHIADVLKVESSVMFVILFLIILVAAFNIISSLIMLVLSKVKDIAILRTMGASRSMVLQVFLKTGTFIGVTGIVIGTILGLAICFNIEPIFESLRYLASQLFGIILFDEQFYYLSKLPAKVNYNEVTFIVIAAFVLTVLSSLYPAWRATKLDPVKGLRYE